MKGVSEFVLLLLIVIVAVITISVLWIYFFSSFKYVTSSEDTSSLGEVLSSCMKIDSVKDNKIYLKNCGSGLIRNDTLNVVIDEESIKFSMNPVSIESGQIAEINISDLWKLNAGNHKLKIYNPSGKVERYIKSILPNSCVLALDFDEGSGNIAYDSSGYGNDGTIYGAQWIDGKFEKALSFDGVNDYIQVLDSSSLDIPSSLTLEAWVKWNGTTNYHQGIIAKRESCADAGNYGLYIANDSVPKNKIRFEFNNGTSGDWTGWRMFDSNKVITPNVWTHIIALLDTQSQKVKIYLNGTQDYLGSTNQVPVATNYKLMIGMNGGCFNQYFNGTIDSLRVYNKALTPDETVSLTLGELA